MRKSQSEGRDKRRQRLKQQASTLETSAEAETGKQGLGGAGVSAGGASGHQRRVIRRQVRETPAESTIWFGIGLTAIGIAAGAGVSAAVVVGDPVTKAILWTVAACVALAALSYFIVHHDVNRGRRVKRSEVVEEYVEEI